MGYKDEIFWLMINFQFSIYLLFIIRHRMQQRTVYVPPRGLHSWIPWILQSSKSMHTKKLAVRRSDELWGRQWWSKLWSVPSEKWVHKCHIPELTFICRKFLQKGNIRFTFGPSLASLCRLCVDWLETRSMLGYVWLRNSHWH